MTENNAPQKLPVLLPQPYRIVVKKQIEFVGTSVLSLSHLKAQARVGVNFYRKNCQWHWVTGASNVAVLLRGLNMFVLWFKSGESGSSTHLQPILRLNIHFEVFSPLLRGTGSLVRLAQIR